MKHTVRCRTGETKELEPYSIQLAVRCHCTECLGWAVNPQDCTATQCPLYPYRGRTGRTQRVADRQLTPEQRARAAEHLNRVREMRQKVAE